MADRLLNTVELADRMNLSPLTLKRWRVEKFGPPWKRLKGKRGEVRYPESLADKWMKEDLNQSRAEELSKIPQESPEPAEPAMVSVYDSRIGKRVLRRKDQ